MSDKRIKLTEEQIAIGMWVYIYLTIETHREDDCSCSVWYLKTRYLAGRDVNWLNRCILCERYKCDTCPLSLKDKHSKCRIGSYYDKACSYLLSEKHRRRALIATRKILRVMIEEEEKKHEKA